MTSKILISTITGKKWLLASVLGACCLTAQAQSYYGNGYTIIAEERSHRSDDLSVMVYKNIKAKNVKYGLQQLLRGSGWRLAERKNADPNIARLYRQAYPDFKRRLNPIKLSDALQYVAGNAWDLVIDPVNKLVSFQLNHDYRCFTLKEASCKVQ